MLTTLDRHENFQLFITCKVTNNADNATHYVKLGLKSQESSKLNYYILSPRVTLKAIIIIQEMKDESSCVQLTSEQVEFRYSRSLRMRAKVKPEVRNNTMTSVLLKSHVF